MTSEIDDFSKHLCIAGRVTQAFREKGWNLIVVGGSALEFYTEGQYLSGDIDVCRRLGQPTIPPAIEREVMGRLNAKSTGTRRQWKIDGVFVDILGEVETAQAPNFRFLQTPEGEIQIMPAEEILIERIFVAYSNTPPLKETLFAAEKMLRAAFAMKEDFDWAYARNLARSTTYDVGEKLDEMTNRQLNPHNPKRDIEK
ncbi:MAG: hypothetical protein IPP19_03890 [Verrucomicrobia bacterium]|nr:hypothetical protein [Verrucomicrobiota bacterium]